MEKQPLSSEQEKLFRQPEALSKQSFTKPIKIKNRQLHKYNVSGYPYKNMSFEDIDIYNFRFNNSTLTNVSFSKGELIGIFFNDTNMVSVTFENLTITDGTFIDTNFGNVVFKNCTLNNPAFGGAKGKIQFINSTLNAPDFYESQAILEFENSTITNESNPREEMFRTQKLPAAITLKDSHLHGAFIGGALASINISGGSITKTGIGGTVGSLEIDHATLDFSTKSDIKTVLISNSNITHFGLGKNIDEVVIRDCKQGENITAMFTKVKNLMIENCDITTFEPLESQFVHFDIRNSAITDMDIQKSSVDELTLNHVHLTNINLEHAQAAQQHFNNVTVAPGGTVKDTGSNIKLH